MTTIRFRFTQQVAARTRAASEILDNPELLAVYVGAGGLPSDLEPIRDHGLAAEAYNAAQSQAGGVSAAAALDVLLAFADLQREYGKVMAVVQAVRGDIARAKTDNDTVKALDKILVNEASVVVRSAPTKEGKTERKASPSRSQEALRAEIAKDAVALQQLRPAHAPLSARKVSAERLRKLRTDAEALSGKLSARTVKKGARKAVTRLEQDAAGAQSECWSSCYRVLALAGAADSRIEALLKEAANS